MEAWLFGIPRGASEIFSRQTKRRLVLAVIGSVFAALLEVVGVAAVLPLMQLLTGADQKTGSLGRISGFFGHPPSDRLALIICAVVFGAFVAKALFGMVFRWWMVGFLAKQEAETAISLLRRYLAAPYSMHLMRNTGSFNRTMNESVGQTYALVVGGGIAVLTELVSVLALAAVLIVLDPIPAIAAIAYFGITGLLFERLVRGPAERVGQTFQEASLDISITAWQTLQGIKEIRVRRTSQSFLERYAAARLRYASARRTSVFLGDLPKSVLEVMFIGGVALLIAVSFSRGNSATTLATLSLFVAAGFRMLPSLTRIIASLQQIRMGRPGVDLLLEDIQNPVLPDVPADDPRETRRLPLRRDLVVDNVVHRYSDGEIHVLDGIDLTIPAGTSVAFVGTSGAGKTTLVDTILGLHTPMSGQVLADGEPISGDLASWQRSIGLVPQDVFLIDDTLRANIALGEPEDVIDNARVAKAVSQAQLDPLIAELPLGLATNVGERGSRLSGGQRQRVGIARALYREPDLLVLDEATSALDNDTERRIAQTIQSLHGKMTIIIVAHRLSTVRNCDLVVFLKSGRVEAAGSFEQVRAASADFAHLVRLGTLDPSPTTDQAPDQTTPENVTSGG